MASDTDIEAAIRAALEFDPRVPEPGEIAVGVVGGAAIMRGTVGSLSERRAAIADAKRTDGVDDIDDQLKVRPLGDEHPEDADIRGMALQRLMWDTEVPADLVDVKVDDGRVTLTGEVAYQFESDAAYDDVAGLVGVSAVTNEIKVVNPGR